MNFSGKSRFVREYVKREPGLEKIEDKKIIAMYLHGGKGDKNMVIMNE